MLSSHFSDTDGSPSQSLDRQLRTFETSSVTDENVADFILGMYDTFKTQTEPTAPTKEQSVTSTEPIVRDFCLLMLLGIAYRVPSVSVAPLDLPLSQ